MKVIIKKTKEEIGNEIASFIIEHVKNKPNTVLGLATGSTPLPIYKSIIEQAKNDNVSFKNTTTFNLDEYVGLDETNDQSYRYFMNENLFKHLDFEKENHNFPSLENYLSYDDKIDQIGGIDIQLLGIGSNGHIAFNEPGTSKESKTHITKLAESTIKDNSRFFNSIEEVPVEAITMGLGTILKSKTIFLIATGKNKAEAIKVLLDGNYVPECPASVLNLKDENVFIYLDEEAASLL